MDGNHVSRLGLRAIGLLDHFVLQARGGSDHAWFLGVFFEEFLASRGRFFAGLGQALFGALLQRGEGFYQLFILDALFFLANGVFDTECNCFRIKVFHAFLSQALAHVQADTVGGFLCRASSESD